jgi:large subunit ribosomal protein L29
MKLKNNELVKLGEKELDGKYKELRKELIKVNAQIASGTVPENPGNVKNIKKNIARILTVINMKKKEGEKK